MIKGPFCPSIHCFGNTAPLRGEQIPRTHLQMRKVERLQVSLAREVSAEPRIIANIISGDSNSVNLRTSRGPVELRGVRRWFPAPTLPM